MNFASLIQNLPSPVQNNSRLLCLDPGYSLLHENKRCVHNEGDIIELTVRVPIETWRYTNKFEDGSTLPSLQECMDLYRADSRCRGDIIQWGWGAMMTHVHTNFDEFGAGPCFCYTIDNAESCDLEVGQNTHRSGHMIKVLPGISKTFFFFFFDNKIRSKSVLVAPDSNRKFPKNLRKEFVFQKIS